MLQQVVSEFQPMLAENGAHPAAWTLPAKLPYPCDGEKIARVFDNLLRNASYTAFPARTVYIAGGIGGEAVTLHLHQRRQDHSPREAGRGSSSSSSGWTAPAPPARAARALAWP